MFRAATLLGILFAVSAPALAAPGDTAPIDLSSKLNFSIKDPADEFVRLEKEKAQLKEQLREARERDAAREEIEPVEIQIEEIDARLDEIRQKDKDIIEKGGEPMDIRLLQKQIREVEERLDRAENPAADDFQDEITQRDTEIATLHQELEQLRGELEKKRAKNDFWKGVTDPTVLAAGISALAVIITTVITVRHRRK